MADLLEKLCNACHYLESEKATERKKSFQQIKNLLLNEKVCVKIMILG